MVWSEFCSLCLMSLAAHWFRRVEFEYRIFIVVFDRQAQWKKSKQIFKIRHAKLMSWRGHQSRENESYCLMKNQIELAMKNFVKLNMVKGSDVAYHFTLTKRALKKMKMFLSLKKIVKTYVQLLLLLWFDSLEVNLDTIQGFLCEFEMKPDLVLFSVENSYWSNKKTLRKCYVSTDLEVNKKLV